MYRRNMLALLGSASLVGLAGCQSGNANLATAAQDVAAIAAGLQTVMPTFAGIKGISPELLAQIGVWVGELQSASTELANVTSATAAEPIVLQVEAALNAIVAAVAGFPAVPPAVSLALSAAVVLLPIIEAAINRQLPPPSPAVASSRARFARSMSPEQARAQLRALAKH